MKNFSLFAILTVLKVVCSVERYEIVTLDEMKAPAIFHYAEQCQVEAVNREGSVFIFKAKPTIAHQLRAGRIITVRKNH